MTYRRLRWDQLLWPRERHRLEALGVKILNNKADNSCHIDRKLVSGSRPKAANHFGQAAARALLDHVKQAE